MDKYILIDGEPQEIDDAIEWAQWFEKADRVVARTTVSDDVKVSTVFLGINHRFFGGGPPILWETMIFGGPHNDYVDRYSSLLDAKIGHERAVRIAKGLEKEDS